MQGSIENLVRQLRCFEAPAQDVQDDAHGGS
jgi:hypothetical protein